MEQRTKANSFISKDILQQYYEAVKVAYQDYNSCFIDEFRKAYPNEFKHLSSVHHKRTHIKRNIEALKELKTAIYFGTLTYNREKDLNKVSTKRKEAFKKLNNIFDYLLLVEEHGEDNGRYHIHFVATFKEGKTFNDFVSSWHSRQNLRQVNDKENISAYLVKYVSKELPRVRRNKKLIALEKEYSHRRQLKRTFPTLFQDLMNKKIFQLSIDDI